MINFENDSDGQTHQIWQQTQLNSCGVASVWMARGIVRQMTFQQGEWGLAQEVFRAAVNDALAPLGADPDGPVTLDPRAHRPRLNMSVAVEPAVDMAQTISRRGFFAEELANAIRAQGISVSSTQWTSRGQSLNSDSIGEARPAIVLVAWKNGGGHFIVAARKASNGKIVFLDPGDGRINEQENNGLYSNPRYGNSGHIGTILYLS